jgi:hypothetical protein
MCEVYSTAIAYMIWYVSAMRSGAVIYVRDLRKKESEGR